jgi:surface antigen
MAIKPGITLLLSVLLVSIMLTISATEVHAQSHPRCRNNELTYLIRKGDTLADIAWRYGTTWARLAKDNHIANPNLIYAGNTLCIPFNRRVHSSSQTPQVPQLTTSSAPTGAGNYFPFGQCTWWANERYYQWHGVYVPWTTNSDAWQWTDRAHDFGWQVSTTPHVGDIVDLQPYVQGAYGLGHVAVVEQVLSNGDVIASNMNWGPAPLTVTNVLFSPGNGVTFIHR